MSGIVGSINTRGSGLINLGSASDGQTLTGTGVGLPVGFEAAAAAGWTEGTLTVTTSGTAVNYTSLPTGIQEILVLFFDVSTSTGHNVYVQIGDSGGLVTSGYLSAGSHIIGSSDTSSVTAAFNIYRHAAADEINGIMHLVLMDSSAHKWVESHAGMGIDGTNTGYVGGGYLDLSNELDRLSIVVAAGAFNLGAVNIMYR
jgi:hypothetical protein|tara:strand:- start:1304 stop:1903 length:600 start_codon:yes stop_codon:yes gene_type:complete